MSFRKPARAATPDERPRVTKPLQRPRDAYNGGRNLDAGPHSR